MQKNYFFLLHKTHLRDRKNKVKNRNITPLTNSRYKFISNPFFWKIYEPDEIADKMLTDYDEQIRIKDIPERLQVGDDDFILIHFTFFFPPSSCSLLI